MKVTKQGGVYRNRSTGSKSEEIKQCVYWENSVGAGKVPMLAIDVTWSVFGPGLVGVFHRWEEGDGGH